MSKKTKQTWDIWVKRTHTFTATINANSLTEATELAKGMSESQLLEAEGETIDSEFEVTGVLRN